MFVHSKFLKTTFKTGFQYTITFDIFYACLKSQRLLGSQKQATNVDNKEFLCTDMLRQPLRNWGSKVEQTNIKHA